MLETSTYVHMLTELLMSRGNIKKKNLENFCTPSLDEFKKDSGSQKNHLKEMFIKKGRQCCRSKRKPFLNKNNASKLGHFKSDVVLVIAHTQGYYAQTKT